MRARFTQSFKIQAVEKVLGRAAGTSVLEISDSLGVGYSTLQKWIVKSRHHEFESVLSGESSRLPTTTREKRPGDWSLAERLTMVTACRSLDKAAISKRCRRQGIYPHHIKQWEQDFVSGHPQNTKAQSDLKRLRTENKALKKELNRKDRALAETAALLVLQKKVHAIWGNDEDNSQ